MNNHNLLLTLGEWWNGLGGIYIQVLYVLAIISSVLLLFQLILALFGFSHGADADIGGDIGGDGFDGDAGGDAGGIHDGHGHGDAGAGLRIFTTQGIIGFFIMYCWTTIAMMSGGMPEWLATILGVILGMATLFALAKLMQVMLKLQESGNIELAGAVGAQCQVYIPIPAAESGVGKVTLTLQSRFIECNAVTRGDKLLKTDAFAKVVGIRGTTLIVEPREEKAENADKESRPPAPAAPTERQTA
jgi:hypothetical protein